MAWLLNLVYLAGILVASPWLLLQVCTKGKYREGLAEKWLGRVPCRNGDAPCIWFHAVSVGEVNLLAPLLAEAGRHWPGCECVVSTTTKTGYTLARGKYAKHTVFYCPLDLSWAVRNAMRRVRPQLLVLAELELWPNLISAARRHGSRVAVINGRLSDRSFRGYGRLRPLVRRLLRQIDLIATQNDEYASRFLALGTPPERVHVTGSVKFDGARTNRDNQATTRLAALAGFDDQDPIFLAGSTQEPEEAAALAAFCKARACHPRLKLVLVPRHPERFETVARLLTESGVRFQRRSRLEIEGVDPAARVLLVDTIGELGAWWGTAQIGFVGGSLGSRGGQNMIEPAAYGVAVCFGPNTHNFRDVVRLLLARRAAVVVSGEEELSQFLFRCLADPKFTTQLSQRAARLVVLHQGATVRTIDLLESLLHVDQPDWRQEAA